MVMCLYIYLGIYKKGRMRVGGGGQPWPGSVELREDSVWLIFWSPVLLQDCFEWYVDDYPVLVFFLAFCDTGEPTSSQPCT